ENIRESVRLGINKINVGSDFMKAQVNQIKTNLKESPAVNYVDLIHETIKAGTKAVKYYIHLSGSTGKSL
ncbi:class II fructose-bisphosphate aldolase, partial [Listeria monocytogenes]